MIRIEFEQQGSADPTRVDRFLRCFEVRIAKRLAPGKLKRMTLELLSDIERRQRHEVANQ